MIYFGSGILNTLINKLPFELHIPGGYQYCGPGTKLRIRLSRGDPGINLLDSACKDHDISYSQNRTNIEERNLADKILAEKAWQRVIAKDSSIGEKAAAYTVANIMKAKSKLGMGMLRKKKIGRRKRRRRVNKKNSLYNFKKVLDAAKKSMKKKTKKARVAIKSALVGARKVVKRRGGKSNFKVPKILSVPKAIGNGLPLIPIFAGLSALGALTNGVTGIVKAINEAKSAQNKLSEATKNNEMMESIAMGKGLYLRPYKTGSGLKLRLHNETQKKKFH